MPVVRLSLTASEKKAVLAALESYRDYCERRTGFGPDFLWDHAHHGLELITRLACAPVLPRGPDGLDGPSALLSLDAPEQRVLEDAVSMFMADCNEQRQAADGWDLARMRHRAGLVIERLWACEAESSRRRA